MQIARNGSYCRTTTPPPGGYGIARYLQKPSDRGYFPITSPRGIQVTSAVAFSSSGVVITNKATPSSQPTRHEPRAARSPAFSAATSAAAEPAAHRTRTRTHIWRRQAEDAWRGARRRDDDATTRRPAWIADRGSRRSQRNHSSPGTTIAPKPLARRQRWTVARTGSVSRTLGLTMTRWQ